MENYEITHKWIKGKQIKVRANQRMGSMSPKKKRMGSIFLFWLNASNFKKHLRG